MADPGRSPVRGGVSFPRELVLASAGTGKTYHLSSTIIALLNAGASPGELLASTFTRKAAGEILDRVLLRLAEAEMDGEALQELSGHSSLPGAPSLDRARVGELLQAVVADLDRLNIFTLDAFFHRVARTFALELGLPPNWSVADEWEAEGLVLAAVDDLLDHADEGELVELLRMYRSGEVRRGVHGELVGIVSALQEIYRDLDPGAEDPWGFPGTGADSPRPEEIEAVADRIAEVELPTRADGTPRKRWRAAMEKHGEALQRGNWEGLFAQGVFAKLLGGEAEYDRVAIPEEIQGLFDAVLRMARAALHSDFAGRAQALGRLAADFEAAFRRSQETRGVFRFQDIPHLLLEMGATGRGDELFYRLDGRIRHLLLDEFQDTSLLQWRTLAPLADEIFQGYAGERAAVVVADPKQSIYAWRGGEPRLLDFIAARSHLPRRTLEESYRSGPTVLDVVNRVFEALPSSTILDAVQSAVAAEWMESFTRHRAARAETPGYARVVEVAGEEHARGLREGVLHAAVEEVQAIRERAPGASVGVLCRTRKAVTHMINLLRRAGVEVSEEGGSPLTDVWPVHVIFAALRAADHPGDLLARYTVSHSPLGPKLGFRDFRSEREGEERAGEIRRRLLLEGYGPVLDTWVRALQPHVSERERARLGQLVELAFRQDQKETPLRPTRFVHLASRVSVEAPGSALVRVMTIHGAKGLEFDAVVLPELERSFRAGGRDHGPLPCREHPAGPVTRVYPYVKQGLHSLFPEVADADRERQSARFRDELGGLYVALTRPRFAVHLLIERGREAAPTPAGLIREGLGLGPGEGGGEAPGTVWESGDPDWAEVAGRTTTQVGGEPFAPERRDGPPGPEPIGMATGPRSRGLIHLSPSELEGRGSRGVSVLLRPRDRGAMARGTLVHLWLAEIGWVEDGIPGEEDLRALSGSMPHPIPDLADLLDRFRKWIRAPAIRRLLSRKAFPDGTEVERELPFLSREGGRLVQGVADRVIRIPGPDGPRLLVVDWKTDRVSGSPGALADRAAYYRPQLESYVRALARSEYVPPERVSGALAFLEGGEVCEL